MSFQSLRLLFIALIAAGIVACGSPTADPAREFTPGTFDPAALLWYDGTEVGEALNPNVPKTIVKTSASSTLKATSTTPNRPGGAASNRYAVAQAFDSDPASAWCEGATGAGVGESIDVRFAEAQTPAALAIVPGYAKNESVWRNNPRVARFRIEFLRSAESLAEFKAAGETPHVREYYGELRRENGSIPFNRTQYFDFRPDFTQDMSMLDFDGVRFEILAVEGSGAKFQDACISELRFYEWN